MVNCVEDVDMVDTVITVKVIFDRPDVLGEASTAGMKHFGGSVGRQARALPRAPFGLRGLTLAAASKRAFHAIDALLWFTSPSLWPARKVCPFSEPSSRAPEP